MYSGPVDLRVIEERPETLSEYGRVPIAFEVRSRLRVEPVRDGLGGLSLIEEDARVPVLRAEGVQVRGFGRARLRGHAR
jgi:hypothetical protein